MNKEMKDLKYALSTRIMIAYYVIAALLFFGYVYIYQYAPLEETWNNVVLNTITAFSALIVAVLATVIYSNYQPEDFPRKIWMYIAIACWFWFYAESAWGVIAYLQGEVATPSVADIGWYGGFFFFSIAFYHQYAIIFTEKRTQIIRVIVAIWVAALLLPLIGLLATNSFTYESYVNYYYPIADLSLGIAGIALMFAFQGGALARAWLGIVVFGISDLFYAWAEQTGLYAWSAENSNTLTLAIDSSYLFAYLLMAFGFIGHWILINYGLRSKR